MAKSVIPPPQRITDDDHGGYILIVTALLTTWSILFILIRAIIRSMGPSHHIASDDIVALAATVLGCIQATIVMIAVDHAGLGNRVGTLTSREVHRTGVVCLARAMNGTSHSNMPISSCSLAVCFGH